MFAGFLSTNINAKENGTLNQIIHQFKEDASKFNALIALEQKLKHRKKKLQLQITTVESTQTQLLSKQNRLENKLDDNPNDLDKEFLKLDEAVITTDLTNNQLNLNQYENDLNNINEQLSNVEKNISLLELKQIDKKKNIKLIITDENTLFENVKRSITYPCEDISLIEQCKIEAKNILLREISEQFAGLELQSITEIDNYLLTKDEVKTESKVTFDHVEIIEQEMVVLADKNYLNLTLSTGVKKELTAQDLILLNIKIDTVIDKYLQSNTQVQQDNSKK
jgi:hypothetical protein